MDILNVEIYSTIILLILIIDYISRFKGKFTTASLIWLTISISALFISFSNISLTLSSIYVIKLISIIIYLLAIITCSLFIFIYVKYVHINPRINIKKEFFYSFLSVAGSVIFATIYVFCSNDYVLHSFDRHFLNKLLTIALIPNAAICIYYIASIIKNKKIINYKIVVTLILTIIGLLCDIKNDSLFFVSAPFTLTALIIYINKHQELLTTDPLTGLYNKRAIDSFVEHLKPNRTIAAFNIDINKFKNINDTYGHHKGDLVLKSVAKILRTSTRERDFVIRNGGDEFLIIASIREKVDALKLYERINENLEKYNKNARIKVGLSIGYDIYTSSSKTSLNEFNKFLKSIDKKMYKEKKIAHQKEK